MVMRQHNIWCVCLRSVWRGMLNWHFWVASRVWQYAAACTKVHWRTRRSFSAPSLTSK